MFKRTRRPPNQQTFEFLSANLPTIISMKRGFLVCLASWAAWAGVWHQLIRFHFCLGSSAKTCITKVFLAMWSAAEDAIVAAAGEDWATWPARESAEKSWARPWLGWAGGIGIPARWAIACRCWGVRWSACRPCKPGLGKRAEWWC